MDAAETQNDTETLFCETFGLSSACNFKMLL